MPQPFEATDVLQHQTISDLSFSWDQSLAACSVRAVNRASGQSTSTLWIYPANGSAPWQMTSGTAFDHQPRWSPDGQLLAFLSDRAGPTQLFLIARNGGEARQLGSLDGSVSDFEWNPDGRGLLVLVSLRVDPNLRGARAAPQAGSPPGNGPQVIWKLPYKADGLGYKLDSETHLFSVDVDSGRATQLTDGAFNVNSARLSPDGRRIVYARAREGDASHRSDVWLMDVDGSNARQLTSQQAQVLFPVWSPDGRWLVFSGTLEEGDALVRLWCIALDSGAVQPLGDDSIEIAGEATSVQFAGQDSGRVRALLARRGVHALAEISVPEGEIRWLVQGERQLSQLGVSSEHLVYTAETPVHPMELYCCSHDGSGERRLSDLNPWWRERPQATYQRHAFEVPDGQGGSERVDGWLIRPEGAQGATPLLLDVHGGPASFALFAYGPSAYWAMLWSQGWSILALNPVGSSSYGRQFSERLRGHWGELDLPRRCSPCSTRGWPARSWRLPVNPTAASWRAGPWATPMCSRRPCPWLRCRSSTATGAARTAATTPITTPCKARARRRTNACVRTRRWNTCGPPRRPRCCCTATRTNAARAARPKPRLSRCAAAAIRPASWCSIPEKAIDSPARACPAIASM